MKNPISLIKTIITTNFVIAAASVLLFAVSRSFDEPLVVQKESVKPEKDYHRAVKVQISDEQLQLRQQQEELNEQKRKIQDLTDKLAYYQQSEGSSSHLSQNPTFSNPSPSYPSTPPQTPIIVIQNPSSLEIPPSPKLQLSRQVTPEVTQISVTTGKKAKTVTVPSSSSSPLKSPPVVSSQRTPKTQPKQPQESVSQGMIYANDVAAGLIVAQKSGQIRNEKTKEYKRFQTAIKLLRQGKSLEQAAQKSNIALEDLQLVMAWGEKRPGNPNKHQPPILSHPRTQLANQVNEPIRYANDISTGLLVAHDKGHIKHDTIQYKRVQTAIKMLREGSTLEQAAHQSGTSLSTLEQLIKWGEVRPGSRPIDWNEQISTRIED